jgi:hypothetical protein
MGVSQNRLNTDVYVRFWELSSCLSRILVLIQALIQWTLSDWFMNLITDLHLVSRLRTRGALPPLPIRFHCMIIKYRENVIFIFSYLAVKGVSVTKSNRLMPFREIISVRYEDNRKRIITLCGKMWIFLMFGFVAKKKYLLHSGIKSLLNTPQSVTFCIGLGIPARKGCRI